MSKSVERVRKRFVVDTNVFVAAIKPFSEESRRASTDTGSLALLIRLINNPELELFANRWLLDEYKRLAEELKSETTDLILGQLTIKTREIDISEDAIARCSPYLPKSEAADVVHAATTLQSNSVLITNDKDFDRIKESKVIEVWSSSEAIRRLSVRQSLDS